MKNPDGFQLQWKIEDRISSALVTVPEKYQSWKGIVHGGILATLLDEAMNNLVCSLCKVALTAEMTVRYVAPAPTGQPLYIRGEITKESRKLVETKAVIYTPGLSGTLIAHATGKMIKVR